MPTFRKITAYGIGFFQSMREEKEIRNTIREKGLEEFLRESKQPTHGRARRQTAS